MNKQTAIKRLRDTRRYYKIVKIINKNIT